jgi:hypothetical protein
MAITEDTFNGDGSNLGPFTFIFPWLESTDIKVSVDGIVKTSGTHYNLQGLNYSTRSGGEVLFTAGNAPGVGTDNIRIYRDTDDTALAATFFPGSAIRSQDLNENFRQSLYVAQETKVTAANTEAAAIANTANTALINSQQALSTATNAETVATGIAATAASAVTTAQNAETTAQSAVTTANAALPKAGGTMTGAITFVSGQAYPQVPQNAKTAAYTLVAGDAGKHISITTGGVTVPQNVFSVGDAISIYNNSAVNQTITQGGGVTLRLAGSSLTGSRSISQYGLCSLLCVASNVFAISGVGLS